MRAFIYTTVAKLFFGGSFIQPNTSEPAMLLRVFKEEKVLEVWIKKQSDPDFHLAKSFTVRNYMNLGPKKSSYDGMVPEGFYYINQLHQPDIGFSINFPNVADKIIQHNKDLQGTSEIAAGENSMNSEILLSKENLKELSIYFEEAKIDGSENILIHIFPFRMSAENLQKKLSEYKHNESLCTFWTMIEPGFSFFEQFHKPPVYSYSRMGYRFLTP